MNGIMRRVGAGLKVSLVFGLVWSVLVTACVFTFGLLAGSSFAPMQFLPVSLVVSLVFYGLLGAVQGLIVAAGMAWSGERRGLTVDTYPRSLGAVFGVITGVAGVVLITMAESWGSGLPLWQSIPWTTAAISGAFGGLATTTLLTIARRGALPTAPTEPKKIEP